MLCFTFLWLADHAGSNCLTAGDAKVSLADGEVSHSGTAHMNHLQADADSTDGPLVVGELSYTIVHYTTKLYCTCCVL